MKSIKTCQNCSWGKIIEAPCKWNWCGEEIEYGPTDFIECLWDTDEIDLPFAFIGEQIHVVEANIRHDCPCYSRREE